MVLVQELELVEELALILALDVNHKAHLQALVHRQNRAVNAGQPRQRQARRHSSMARKQHTSPLMPPTTQPHQVRPTPCRAALRTWRRTALMLLVMRQQEMSQHLARHRTHHQHHYTTCASVYPPSTLRVASCWVSTATHCSSGSLSHKASKSSAGPRCCEATNPPHRPPPRVNMPSARAPPHHHAALARALLGTGHSLADHGRRHSPRCAAVWSRHSSHRVEVCALLTLAVVAAINRRHAITARGHLKAPMSRAMMHSHPHVANPARGRPRAGRVVINLATLPQRQGVNSHRGRLSRSSNSGGPGSINSIVGTATAVTGPKRGAYTSVERHASSRREGSPHVSRGVASNNERPRRLRMWPPCAT